MSGGGCVYCGLPRALVVVAGRVVRLVACRAHADVLELDPHYGLASQLEQDAISELVARRLPAEISSGRPRPP